MGWYCGVLQEGEMKAGLPVELLRRDDTVQTVAQAFQANIRSD
jgi:MOSC domain-containing protein YiiM